MGPTFTRSKVSYILDEMISHNPCLISAKSHLTFFQLLKLFTHFPEGSPLFQLVEPGDIILTVDGVDCSTKDSDALAHWIRTKPAKSEQTLTLLDLKGGDPPAHDDEQMSV